MLNMYALVGFKSMVVQGVKNPLVNLLSLEDKTTDEVKLFDSVSMAARTKLHLSSHI